MESLPRRFGVGFLILCGCLLAIGAGRHNHGLGDSAATKSSVDAPSEPTTTADTCIACRTAHQKGATTFGPPMTGSPLADPEPSSVEFAALSDTQNSRPSMPRAPPARLLGDA